MAHEFWPELEQRVAAWGGPVLDITPEMLLDLHRRLGALEATVARLIELHPQLAAMVAAKDETPT